MTRIHITTSATYLRLEPPFSSSKHHLHPLNNAEPKEEEVTTTTGTMNPHSVLVNSLLAEGFTGEAPAKRATSPPAQQMTMAEKLDIVAGFENMTDAVFALTEWVRSTRQPSLRRRVLKRSIVNGFRSSLLKETRTTISPPCFHFTRFQSCVPLKRQPRCLPFFKGPSRNVRINRNSTLPSCQPWSV
jgi:hypothetical protein